MSLPPGTFIQMACSRTITRLSRQRGPCNSYWWCIALSPCTVGGTFAALFDYHAGRIFLYRLFAQTHQLSDDDLWGFEVVPRESKAKLLQIAVSPLEARQQPASSVTQRILKALSAAL